MKCNSCEYDISLSKNIKRSNKLRTEKNINKCPECGEELEKQRNSNNILEKSL